MSDGPSSNWWPYGEMAEQLANHVLNHDQSKARDLSTKILRIADQRRNYDVLVRKLCDQMHECKWDAADATLGLMDLFDDVVKCDLAYYQTAVHFERDTTALDRIVEETEG